METKELKGLLRELLEAYDQLAFEYSCTDGSEGQYTEEYQDKELVARCKAAIAE